MHNLSLSTMTSSTHTQVNDLSTLSTELPQIRKIGNAFQLSFSSECGKTLSLVCVPPELILDPDHFYSWVATRPFVDENTLPPQNAADVMVAVIGVLGDYATYDRIGKAVSKLAGGYEILFDCLQIAKDKRSTRSAVVVKPRKGLRAKKRSRKPAEHKPRSHPSRLRIPTTAAPPATAASLAGSPNPPATTASPAGSPPNSPTPGSSPATPSPQPATSHHSISPQPPPYRPFRAAAESSSVSSMNVSLPDSLPSPIHTPLILFSS